MMYVKNILITVGVVQYDETLPVHLKFTTKWVFHMPLF